MRYTASEKLEIIQLVERSPLSVRCSLLKIGVSKSTFYAWLNRYHEGGLDALVDRKPKPRRVWNRIPDLVRQDVVELALEEPELNSREVAVAFTDRRRSFVAQSGGSGQLFR